jgi:phospholipase C
MTYRASLLCFAAALSLMAANPAARSRAEPSAPHKQGGHEQSATATPIQHLVVIFQENVSFDHYFGTYPKAENRPGETRFSAAEDSPRLINGLRTPLDVTQGFRPLRGVSLLRNNPNANPNAPAGGTVTNGADASNPIRLSPAQALTADQGHNYLPEQQAFDNGLMDAFPAFTGVDGPPPAGTPPIKGLVMGYYDGNTVTALWNYAQHFALSDNSWTTTFGPSTPGALNLISGQTNGFDASANVVDGAGTLLHATHEVKDGNGNFSEIGDGDPLLDVCSSASLDQITMHGRNIGDLLNAKHITWGWFEGGFDLSVVNPNGTTGCARETDPTAPGSPAFTSTDYIPHHEPFQYYASTRNPTHARPSSVAAIGHSNVPGTNAPDPANHQYDLNDFFAAMKAGNLPAVSFLKAAAFEDGHAGYSDPLDEQHFLVRVINALQMRPEWRETAVIIAYDDSDGWYDHQMPPVVNPSSSSADALNGPGVCNKGLQQGSATPSTPLDGSFGGPVQGRCGYGTRLPLLVVSPFAKSNHVDHTLTDQTSIVRFIEDNWLSGERIQPGGSFDTIAGPLDNMFDFDKRDFERRLILNETTGAVVLATPVDDDSDPNRH